MKRVDHSMLRMLIINKESDDYVCLAACKVPTLLLGIINSCAEEIWNYRICKYSKLE
jgi:hypothetical protein